MEHYINNFLFTYFPHIAIAVFWFGTITRFRYANRKIQAKSTQFLSKKNVTWSNNFFHYGIIAVFMGHLTLFLPEEIYHLVMTTETKRLIALSFGTLFGSVAVLGMLVLLLRRLTNERVKYNSVFHDYFILSLLIVEATLGLMSVGTTAASSVEKYAALGEWAQKIITFQPDASSLIASHSIIYKAHIFVGLLIIMIFPYTKLMHLVVYPFTYMLRSGYQIVRRQSK